MIAVMAPLRRNRWFSLGIVLGAVFPAVALGVLSLVGSPPSGRRVRSLEAERRAFNVYERAIERAVQDGGFVVTQGMQPGLADIAEGALPDTMLEKMARGWKRSMQKVRRDLAAVEPPGFLRETARRYDAALAAYFEVGEVLLAAAEAREEERTALVEEAASLGNHADDLWEKAHAEFERQRARLGLREEDRDTGGADDAER